MFSIEIWKIVTDVLLAAGLVYLGWRLLSSGRLTQATSRLNELELELKRIISQAEESGRTLGDHLLKRQQDLERLLGDIGNAEYRVNKIISSAEENKASLQSERQRLENIVSQAREISAHPPMTSVKTAIKQEKITPVIEREVEPVRDYHNEFYAEQDPEPPSFAAEAGSRAAAAPARAAQARVNIYGEPIEEVETVPALSAQVEKQVNISRPQAAPRPSLEQIYKAAAEMLRAGEDLQVVASKTNLGVPELRRIAQILARPSVKAASAKPAPIELEIEPEVVQETPRKADPRLGVLGGIKRQVQVL